MSPPTRLRCEYFVNPVGIDVTDPRFSWQMTSDKRGAKQSAYEIEVRDANGEMAWDSGKVVTDQSIHVKYRGRPLVSRDKLTWTLQTWDENDVASGVSEPATFEMGLLEPTDWKAEWIGGSIVGGSRTSVPVPFLRKPFTLKSKPKSARLYVTAAGLYEARINGKVVTQDILTPGWTDFNKRVRYQVYDVGSLLSDGQNALGAILGDGWFCGCVEWRGRQLYGDRPEFLAQLEVTYEDGTMETIVTDSSWTHAYGPIISADILMGEAYDARLEFHGWDLPWFDGAKWHPVDVLEGPKGALVGMSGPPVKKIMEITPIEVKEIPKWPNAEYLFDMGQNMVGHVRLRVSGPAGTTIRLRFAEVLTPDGNIYTENLRSATQTDFYTLKGDGDETWEPKFTFHGFRYVEVKGYPGTPTKDAITGIVVHSDTPPTGEFECSDPLVNQLQHNIQWGQRGNFVDVPTDCPQRDERLGWTGDAQVFIRTAAFNMDVASFFEKWINDLEDSQGEKGEIPPTAPMTPIVGADGGPAWADAFVICPWTIYQCYGDRRILERHYPAMRRWLAQQANTSKDLIRSYPEYEGFKGFGDWLSTKAETPIEIIGTAFFAHCTLLMSKIASELGLEKDASAYFELRSKIQKAFTDAFLTPGGALVSGTQTTAVLALHFDLVPDQHRAKIAQALVDDIGNRGWHLSTGFVGTPYLAEVLTDAGRLDVAYKLLLQKTWPSWLYPVTKGATTIWERWDGWTDDKGFQDAGMNSFNHYAYGAIGEWMYSRVAGIDLDPEAPAYKRILFGAHPGGEFTYAKASLESMYGRIVSDWKIEGGTFTWNVVVPPNTTARIAFPAGCSEVAEGGKAFGGGELASGSYAFNCKYA